MPHPKNYSRNCDAKGIVMEKYFNLSGADFNIRCKMYFRLSGLAVPEADDDLPPASLSVRRVIVFCHGFAGHRDNMAARRLSERILARNNDTAVIIFNLPAHGDDEHKYLSLDACDKYLDTIIKFVRDTYNPDIVDACATSFGGYLILKYLTDHDSSPFRRICLRCPAIVMHDILTDVILPPEDLKTLSEGGYVFTGFDRLVGITSSFMEELKKEDVRTRDFRKYADRIRIVQGTKDELVPYYEVKKFADKNGISCRLVEDADHRFLDPAKMAIVIETFMDFLGL